MAGLVHAPKRSFLVNAAMGAYLRVKWAASGLTLAGATDVEFGVTEEATTASTFGQSFWPVDIAIRLPTAEGTCKMTASGAVTAGADVYADASGKVTATVGAVHIGKAIDAASNNGDVIEVLRTKSAGAMTPVILGGSTSITAAIHQGRDLVLNGTGSAFTQTLPAATGSGARYKFTVGAVNTSNHVISAATSADLFKGFVMLAVGGSAGANEPFAANGSTNYILTLNGTTKGGSNIGGWLEFIDVAANEWIVRGDVMASGSLVTPFSG